MPIKVNVFVLHISWNAELPWEAELSVDEVEFAAGFAKLGSEPINHSRYSYFDIFHCDY